MSLLPGVGLPAAVPARPAVPQAPVHAVNLSAADFETLAADLRTSVERVRMIVESKQNLNMATVDQLKAIGNFLATTKGLRVGRLNGVRKAFVVDAVAAALFNSTNVGPTPPVPAPVQTAPAPAPPPPPPAAHVPVIPPAGLTPAVRSQLQAALPANHVLSYRVNVIDGQEILVPHGRVFPAHGSVTHAVRFILPPRDPPDARLFIYLYGKDQDNGQTMKPKPQQAWAMHRVVIKISGRIVILNATDANTVYADVTPSYWNAGTAATLTIDMPRYFISHGYIMVAMTSKVTDKQFVEQMYRRAFDNVGVPVPDKDPAGIERTLDVYRKRLGEAMPKRVLAQTGGNDDIEETEAVVKLACPLSLKAPIHPARGIKCPHIECFDALSFCVMYATSKSKLKCAVCNRSLTADVGLLTVWNRLTLTLSGPIQEVIIDPFYCHLLETYTGKTSCVVKPDGTHCLSTKAAIDAFDVDSVPITTPAPKRPVSEVIDLDDDDNIPQIKKPKGPTIVIEID